MPKLLFYAGTVCCFAVALTSGALAFVSLPATAGTWWSIAIALLAGLAIAALFLRMAALLAARNLFAALMAVLFVAAATASLAGLLLLQWRMTAGDLRVAEVHFAELMAVAFFVSLSLLSLRPYFKIQASRLLSALVLLPLPLFLLVLAQQTFAGVFLAVMALLFFSIAVHCIRHRHLFLEMTNLRELLDPRGDHRGIGGVAFDS